MASHSWVSQRYVSLRVVADVGPVAATAPRYHHGVAAILLEHPEHVGRINPSPLLLWESPRLDLLTPAIGLAIKAVELVAYQNGDRTAGPFRLLEGHGDTGCVVVALDEEVFNA